MKRILVAPVVLVLALTLSPGVAYAGGSSGAAGQNGSNGASGSSNANCLGAISIVIKWFGWGTGTNTQCQRS